MPSNRAALLLSKENKPLVVQDRPYTSPKNGQIVIKNRAVAINLIDWFKQIAGGLAFDWVKYPIVMGSDCAGEVFEVGHDVTEFKPGDRVIGHSVWSDKSSTDPAAEGAFQDYTIVRTNLASPIPDFMSFEDASVIPLCLSTAACGLFLKDQLALDYPRLDVKPNNKTVLIWGGSTSVGGNAIQLAAAAGYRVFTTASPKNHELVKGLGAVSVFDYRSPTVIEDVTAALQHSTVVGALAIGEDSFEKCMDVISALPNARKFVSQASAPLNYSRIEAGGFSFILALLAFMRFMISTAIKARFKGISYKMIFGSDLMRTELGAKVYQDFLPQALAERKFVPYPSPVVVGNGLEKIQEAMDINKRGVSAKKVVVTL